MIPLGLTEAESATDAAVQTKVHASRTTLIISNEQMNNIKKFGSLIKGVGETNWTWSRRTKILIS